VEDLLRELGDIPPQRVLLNPAPGTATEVDLLRKVEVEKRSCELIHGTLVEKPVGLRESLLAIAVAAALREFVIPRNLGLVGCEASTLRITAGVVRLPDVAFISWGRIPGGRIPSQPVPPISPDLAVEILSESNTRKEMSGKRREYFDAGTVLVWEIDPDRRCATVYTEPEAGTVVDANGTLDGGNVLPGFSLDLQELFAELDRTAPNAS